MLLEPEGDIYEQPGWGKESAMGRGICPRPEEVLCFGDGKRASLEPSDRDPALGLGLCVLARALG